MVRDRMLSMFCFCASTSRHLIWISIACRCPVGGTRGWCSMAVACSSMKRLPFSPADSSMHDWPMATPTPTVCTCGRQGRGAVKHCAALCGNREKVAGT